MENEHGEIRKDDVEDKDFNTIVKISSLRHKGFWTTPILLPRPSRHDAVERTPSKNWAFQSIFDALRCFHPSPKKEFLFEIRNRCVLIRSLNTDLVVLLRQELFYVYFLFSDPSLKNSFPLLPWDWLLALMKHNLLLHMMTLLLKCDPLYLYSPCNALANFSSRVSLPSISL